MSEVSPAYLFSSKNISAQALKAKPDQKLIEVKAPAYLAEMSNFLLAQKEKWALVTAQVEKPQPLSFWRNMASVSDWLEGINELVRAPVTIEPISMYYEYCYHEYPIYDDDGNVILDQYGMYATNYVCEEVPEGFPEDFIDDVEDFF